MAMASTASRPDPAKVWRGHPAPSGLDQPGPQVGGRPAPGARPRPPATAPSRSSRIPAAPTVAGTAPARRATTGTATRMRLEQGDAEPLVHRQRDVDVGRAEVGGQGRVRHLAGDPHRLVQPEVGDELPQRGQVPTRRGGTDQVQPGRRVVQAPVGPEGLDQVVLGLGRDQAADEQPVARHRRPCRRPGAAATRGSGVGRQSVEVDQDRDHRRPAATGGRQVGLVEGAVGQPQGRTAGPAGHSCSERAGRAAGRGRVPALVERRDG